MRYGQLVMGPAGSGKSTFCTAISRHAETINRNVRVVNLDPAAEEFQYECIADIRNLIHVEDVMEDEELKLGPNGALVYCMEYLCDNLDFLQDQLGDADDDYVLFDCPGQIELFTHSNAMKTIVESLKKWNFNLCGVFLLDTQFLLDIGKFLSGSLAVLSTMVHLELPAVNVLSKMDLLSTANKAKVEEYLDSDCRAALLDQETQKETAWNKKYRALSSAIGQVLDDYSLVGFTPCDITDEDNLSEVLMSIDTTIQYGEENEVRDRYPEEMDTERDNGLY